eukprot:SAG22_NODE_129_length_18679_cov_40.656028_2_plen_121_part_00
MLPLELYLYLRRCLSLRSVCPAVLSLGEQQKIGVARMLYHRPKFGVMDECTSAVSVDAEAELYKAVYELGITCITISQRLGLEQFHSTELRFGANTAEGWTRHEIEAKPSGTEELATFGF